MMINHTSRRSFLSSLALLSAGTVLGSVPGFIKAGSTDCSAQQSWKLFVKRYGGKSMAAGNDLSQKALQATVKGHTAKAGEPVHFASDGLIAIPCWIYWANNPSAPSDVTVTFFNDAAVPEKIMRINRYELEGLLNLQENGGLPKQNPLTFMTAKREDNLPKIKIKTKIRKSRPAEVIASFA